ncbi:phage tail protein [Bacillus sp. FSL K6-6540]|uniref:phage tail protein n=1 Tax=Bacillus sp. FSL K6-6540 TaxID=2921512 RepID=UPI0030F92A33
MSSNTPNLGLLKKDPMVDGNETFNIETMLNENWDKVDEAVGQVREDLGNIDVDIPEASLTEKGIVQLSSATNGTRENVAATEKAVKAAYDEALAGKQLGVEQKANVVAALNSIGVAASTSEAWAQLVAKMAGVIKATGNATAGDVLAGKTFSNAVGNNRTGTMPNRGAGGLITPGTTNITKQAGYYSSDIIIRGEPNKIPGNIRVGVSLDGVPGSLEPSVSGLAVINHYIYVSDATGLRDQNNRTVDVPIVTIPAGVRFVLSTVGPTYTSRIDDRAQSNEVSAYIILKDNQGNVYTSWYTYVQKGSHYLQYQTLSNRLLNIDTVKTQIPEFNNQGPMTLIERRLYRTNSPQGNDHYLSSWNATLLYG